MLPTIMIFDLALWASICSLVTAVSFSPIPPGLIANSSDVTLTQPCQTAIEAAIRCDPYFQYLVSVDVRGYNDPPFLDSLCTADCSADLEKYHSTVVSSCAGNPYPWDGTPPQHFGDQVWASYNMTCLKDSSGQYCQSEQLKFPCTIFSSNGK